MDEQEHSASPETPASGETAPAAGQTPVTEPRAVTGTATGPARERRADGVRDVITSRGAGWAAAAAMAGAVVGLSIAMATSSSPTVGAARAALPGGALRAVAPGGRVQAQAPARLRLQAPVRLRIHVPAGGPLQAPPRLRLVPDAGPLQEPPPLRLVPDAGPAGTLIPLPGAAQVPGTAQELPGRQAIAGVPASRVVRLRVRPGQVRVRLRVPANGRLQLLPGSPASRPLRAVLPGQRPAALVPAAPARLRIAFRNGAPIPARLLIPASLPGQARLRIQVPARARITPALPAPPNW